MSGVYDARGERVNASDAFTPSDVCPVHRSVDCDHYPSAAPEGGELIDALEAAIKRAREAR